MEKLETVYYRIGELTIRIESDLPFPLPDGNAADFRTGAAEADVRYRFQAVTDIPALTGAVSVVDENMLGFEMLGRNGKYYRGFWWKERFYDSVLEQDENGGTISYVSSSIVAERCQSGFNFISYLGLENIFLRRGGLFLHSSHLNVGGKALLFSAPSGTGKSTQADLWHAATGAEIINGDRSLLRKKDGVWHAYGCPMCGTSGIHRQGDEPVHAIVMLEQGKENALRRLGAAEAFSLLYPQVTIPKWSRELVLRGMELLDSVIAEVPVYHYSCTKTEDAVTTLRSALGL